MPIFKAFEIKSDNNCSFIGIEVFSYSLKLKFRTYNNCSFIGIEVVSQEQISHNQTL